MSSATHRYQGYEVTQLFEAVRYKPEADSIPDGVTEYFIDTILPATLWPWVVSASNRNEYQEYFLVVKAAG